MTENSPERQFKGVWIPKEIWEHTKLTWLQKCVVAEIDSLSSDDKPCNASNAWLSKRFGVTEGRMAHIISELRQLGIVETVSFNGRSRDLKITHSGDKAALSGSDNPALSGSDKAESPSVYRESTGIDYREVALGDEASRIYALYPRKVSRPKAIKAILKAIKSGFSVELLVSKTTKYAHARTGQDPQFTPHPATWFNDERFNDDPETWKNGNHTKSSSSSSKTDRQKLLEAQGY